VGDRLRPTWDFDDLDGSQQRFRALLDEEQNDAGRAEVLTQLARVEGLSDRFDEGDTLLDEAEALAGETPVVRARIDLERGRLRRSSGDAEFATALAIPHEFLAVDAAHMVAIAAPEFETRLAWSNRGIDLAGSSSDPEVTAWLGSLFNNLGWDYFDAGDYETALTWFERALVEREKRPDEPKRIELAREAVEEARSKLQPSPPAA
jgi:tetratricopeptide (TPR) repeat protein